MDCPAKSFDLLFVLIIDEGARCDSQTKSWTHTRRTYQLAWLVIYFVVFSTLPKNESSSSGSGSIVVGASKQSAVSFREAHFRSGSEDDNASGVGYDPPVDSWIWGNSFLSLQALMPWSSEIRISGSFGTCFTPPLCGSQGLRWTSLLEKA